MPNIFNRENFIRSLRPEHPRLFADAARWAALREQAETSEPLAAVIAILRGSAAEMMDASPLDRVLEGRRLLAVSREVLKRVLTLGVLFRVTGEHQLRDRIGAEVLNAARFTDWNPSHFLDTAEMTLALAVAYDWLYEEWREEERSILKQAIIEKGLQAGRGPLGWKSAHTNWNQVCFAGMIAGALAVGEDEPDLAVEYLNELAANAGLPLDACLPDGAYPEGPGYWSYGMHFQIILLSVLESALGTTLGIDEHPAFAGSPVFINVVTGPSERYFNYADGNARVQLKPALHWFAARASNPGLDARERARLRAATGSESESARAHDRNRFLPLAFFWLNPELGDTNAESQLPLHWLGDGINPIAVHRSSWERNAAFIGIKGGSPSVNHGHMDVGSFVLDWKGVRWAADLGAQDYHSLESVGLKLWDRAQDSERWQVFRLGSFSHNTLVIDGKPQQVDGSAPITGFSGSPEDPFTVVDLTPVYTQSLDRVVRGVRMIGNDAILMHDALSGINPGQSVRWGMVTEAEVDPDGQRAILRQEGRVLHVRILAPREATFQIVQTDPPPHKLDVANPGTQMLAFFSVGSSGGTTRDLKVVFSADELSDDRLEAVGELPPPSQWSGDLNR